MFGFSWLRIVLTSVVLLALAAGAWKFRHTGVVAGRAEVQVKWDKERAEQVQAALAASEKRRIDLAAASAANQGVTDAYRKREAVLAAGKRNADERLRALQAAAGSASIPDSAPLGGADDPRPAIISQCATALGILDNDFKNLASQTTSLQDYARLVCVRP